MSEMTPTRRLSMVAAIVALAVASIVAAFAWTGTTSGLAALAWIGTWDSTPSQPAVPPECEGMTFAEVIVGTPGNDKLEAKTKGGALIFGLGGNDRITGSKGDDCLVGNEGKDAIQAMGGNDVVIAGAGDDVVYGGDGKDRLFGNEGNDYLVGDVERRDRDHGDQLFLVANEPGHHDGGDRAIEDRLDGGADYDRCFGRPNDNYARCEQINGRGADRRVPVTPIGPTRGGPGGPIDGIPTPAPTDGAGWPPSPGADPTPTPSTDPTPTDPGADPTPTAYPTADPVPTPTPDPAADPTPTPTPDPTADPTPTPTPDPTADPTPTPTPAPTPDPTPEPTIETPAL